MILHVAVAVHVVDFAAGFDEAGEEGHEGEEGDDGIHCWFWFGLDFCVGSKFSRVKRVTGNVFGGMWSVYIGGSEQY